MGWFARRKSGEDRPSRTAATPEWLNGVEEHKRTLHGEQKQKRSDYAAYCAEFGHQWGPTVAQRFKEVRAVLKRHRKVGPVIAPRRGAPPARNGYAWSLSEPTTSPDEWTTEHGQLLLELRLTISDEGDRYVEIKGDVRDAQLPYAAPIHLMSFEDFSEETMQRAFREIVEFWLHPDVH